MATSPVLFVYYPPLNDDSYPGVPARHITEADWASFTIAQRRTIENATTQEGYTRRKVWVHIDLVDETEQERADREAAEAAARAEFDRKNSLVRYGQIESMIEQLEVLPPAEEFAALRADVEAVAEVPPRIEAVETALTGKADAAEMAQLRQDVDAVAEVPPRVEAVETDVTRIKLGQTYRNLRAEGVDVTGASDQSAVVQSLIDSATNGTVFTLDENANLRLESQVQINGKRVDLLGFGAAKITKTAPLNMPLIRVESVPDIRINDLTMEGGETAYANTSNTGHWALGIYTSPRASVSGIAISGFSRGISIDGCPFARIDNVQFEGLLEENETWAQHHTTLRILGSNYAALSRIAGRNCGSAILVGGASLGGRIWGVEAINCWDNGVYISEGHDWDISGVVAIHEDPSGTTTTGVKARGSRNHVHHCTVIGHSPGIVLTGYGTTGLDSEGFCGSGSKATHNTIRDVLGTAIILDLYSGVAAREFEASDNLIVGCGTSGATSTYGIHIPGSSSSVSPRGVRVNRNRIVNYLGGGPGIRFIGANATYPFIAPEVRGNEFRNFTGGSQAAAIRANHVHDGMFADNRLEEITAAYPLHIENGVNNIVTGTYKRGNVGSGSQITIRNETTSTGTRIYLNHNSVVSDAGTDTVTTP